MARPPLAERRRILTEMAAGLRSQQPAETLSLFRAKKTRPTRRAAAWPETMSQEQAASFLGVSPKGFEALVDCGYLPLPVENVHTGTMFWSPATIEAAFDDLPFALRAAHRAPPFVYFVRLGRSGPIKIGIAKNVRARVFQIQTHSPRPVDLLATEIGGRRREAALHKRFERLASHGEWFRPGPDLLTHIASLPQLLDERI